MPWFDYNGRFSWFKFAVFASLFLPAAWTAYLYWHGDLGVARPVNEAIHEIGRWMIRLVFVALAITPLSRILDWPRLTVVRRMIGVAAFAYGTLHITLYWVDQAFNTWKVVTEIALRIYLEIGFTALLILAALAVTSTDGMVRRLGGRNWQRLHRLVYLAAGLAVIHHFMQSKADVDQPWVMAGLYVWLMSYRLVDWAAHLRGRVPLWAVACIGAAAVAFTAFGEAVYYWIKVNAPPLRVLAADISLSSSIRPAWIVLAIALAIVVAGAVRRMTKGAARRKPTSAVASGA